MAKKQKFTEEDDALLAKLGIEVEAKKIVTHTPREERIIAGFEEIQKFVEEHGHLPQHGEDKDIFERLYAVRLDQIRKQEECRVLLANIDSQNLLEDTGLLDTDIAGDIGDDELLEQLGVNINSYNSITTLKHVKPRAEIRAAEEIASRKKCEDFDNYKHFFEEVIADIKAGRRVTRQQRKDAGLLKAQIKVGDFFIVNGQTLYIAEIGERIKASDGSRDARLRVIYSNGTESNILLETLRRAIYKDETSRIVSEPNMGPLFTDERDADDLDSGTIYVLRSKSDHPAVKENRNIVHKIGVTGGDVQKRITNAKNDPTFLMDDVEVVATYKLANINRSKLENLRGCPR